MRPALPAAGADETELPAPAVERRINAVQESIPAACVYVFLCMCIVSMHMEDEAINSFMNHRAPANGRYKPTCYEHAANCYTHAFLIVPAIVGSALLHRLSDDCWEKITAWIYGMGLCALFIVSTVFHIVSWKKSHLSFEGPTALFASEENGTLAGFPGLTAEILRASSKGSRAHQKC
ncbi:hypothetical protein STEG23_035845 [Scotinomys teguina]